MSNIHTLQTALLNIGRCGDVPALGMLTYGKEQTFALVRSFCCCFLFCRISLTPGTGGCPSTSQGPICSKSESWQAWEGGYHLLYKGLFVSCECGRE